MSDQVKTDDYKLFELHTLDEVCQPIQGSTRVRYTCLDATSNFLILGATSGSLYVFQRHPQLQYVKVVTSKEGAVTALRISPNEKYFAVGTSKGVVSIIQHDIPSKTLHVSKDHLGSCVTCVHWNQSESSLYIGDDKGKVTSVNITLKKAHSIFSASTALIVQLSAAVVQLDISANKLLVSCHTATFLCDIGNEKYSRIGTKPREGSFGSCFYMEKIIYCARPGTRLWEVDFKGRVLFTHQLKQALTKAPTPVVSIKNDHYTLSHQNSPGTNIQSINFNHLHVISKRFIITWAGSHLFIFDPPTANIVLWSSFASDIKDLKVTKSEVFISFLDGKLAHFHMLPVDGGIEKLIRQQKWRLAAAMCVAHEDKLLTANCKVRHKHLQKLSNHLSDDEHLFKQISSIIKRLEELYPLDEVNGNRSGYQVESGIFVVSRPSEETPPNHVTNAKLPKNAPPDAGTSDANLDALFFGSHNIGMLTPFISSQILDPAFTHLGYETIASLASNVSLGDLRSKYHSGKEKILTTMGQIEDMFKINHVDTAQPLLDVRSTDNPRTENVKQRAKTKSGQMPKHYQILIEASHETWNEILSVGQDKAKLHSVLNYWVDVLNDSQMNHYKHSKSHSKTEQTAALHRTKSFDDGLSTKVNRRKRRKSCPAVLDHQNWCLNNFLWWQNLLINCSGVNTSSNWLNSCPAFVLSREDNFKVSQLAALCLSNSVFGQIGNYAASLSDSSDLSDCARSLFIYHNFHQLNPRHIKSELERDLDSPSQKSWKALFKRLVINKPEDETFNPLLHCFQLASRAQSEDVFEEILCKLTTANNLVTPRDVLFLDKLADYGSNLLLRYMDETIERQFSRACQDSIVSYEWIKAVLSHSAPISQLKCECGTPKAGSHKFPWIRSELLMQILRSSKINKFSVDLCQKYGYWLGYIYACNKTSLRSESLTALVYLGDIQLFQDLCNAEFLPKTNEEWESLFHSVNTLTDTCPTCHQSLRYESHPLLTIESAAENAINYIGPQTLLRLLNQLSPTPKISSRFLRMCTSTAAVKIKQRSRYHDDINHFVWAKHRNYASAEIRNSLLNEYFKKPGSTIQMKERVRSQWGISLDMKSLCFKCSLPLVVPLTEQLSPLGGVRVYCCGHGFHLFCIREGDSACPRCATPSQLK